MENYRDGCSNCFIEAVAAVLVVFAFSCVTHDKIKKLRRIILSCNYKTEKVAIPGLPPLETYYFLKLPIYD